MVDVRMAWKMINFDAHRAQTFPILDQETGEKRGKKQRRE
jgi:hypothetical protein